MHPFDVTFKTGSCRWRCKMNRFLQDDNDVIQPMQTCMSLSDALQRSAKSIGKQNWEKNPCRLFELSNEQVE